MLNHQLRRIKSSGSNSARDGDYQHDLIIENSSTDPSPFTIYEESCSDPSSGNGVNATDTLIEDYFDSTENITPDESNTNERDITDVILWNAGHEEQATLENFTGIENNDPHQQRNLLLNEQNVISPAILQECYNPSHEDAGRFPSSKTTANKKDDKHHHIFDNKVCVMMAISGNDGSNNNNEKKKPDSRGSFSYGSGLPISSSRLDEDTPSVTFKSKDPRELTPSSNYKNTAQTPSSGSKRQSLNEVDTTERSLNQQLTNYSNKSSGNNAVKRESVTGGNHHKSIRPSDIFSGFAGTMWTKTWSKVRKVLGSSSSDREDQEDITEIKNSSQSGSRS